MRLWAETHTNPGKHEPVLVWVFFWGEGVRAPRDWEGLGGWESRAKIAWEYSGADEKVSKKGKRGS